MLPETELMNGVGGLLYPASNEIYTALHAYDPFPPFHPFPVLLVPEAASEDRREASLGLAGSSFGCRDRFIAGRTSGSERRGRHTAQERGPR